MYEALLDFVLRAPLLPERELGRGRAALEEHALGSLAIALASRGLAAAKASAARGRALERYGRRAAFRATPQGLLAGVCVGTLAKTTRIATGTSAPWLAPTWGRMEALGRALLDDPSLRPSIALRVAPSLVRGAATARWLAPGAPFGEVRVAELDAPLAAILDAATAWAPWTEVRRAAGSAAPEADVLEQDDLLLLLVDDGLLQADVTPPLVGARPDIWMRARLERLARGPFAEALARAAAALARGDLAGGAAALASLPGAARAGGADVHGVLVHRPRTAPTLARAVVARAAGLAPLLFRLQDALVPPASERLAQPSFDAALDAVTEAQGPGAFDLAALEAGDYGVTLDGDSADGDEATAGATPPSVLTALVDAIVEAARARRPEATLDPAKLTAAFATVGPAPPQTCELFLAPARAPRGAREGTGWLLGLHAPAGASWGRFAAALGAPLARALAALSTAEREARPLEEPLDVSYAPSAALADLCTHPPLRRRTLALSTWSAADGDVAGADLAFADLELVACPGAATPLALRARAGETPVVPSPLARVRSSTAPAGALRLVCGWSLTRQHAPWALALGPLAALAHVPRLVLDGFVVAPASFRLPAGRPTRARLARWRRDAGVPRWIQVGYEDQLLPVDLDSPTAARDVAGHARAWEIWPPPGAAVDRDGRRVEAILALVDRPDADEAVEHARAARATAAAGRVPPPRREPPPAAWATYKIFGAPEHAEALLLDVVLPTIAAARRAGELTQWFFLRYVDGPGPRHHLRVRTRAADADDPAASHAAFATRLARALAPARATGAVVTVETADYHPERARYGAALAPAHEIFESDSETACALLAEEEAPGGEAPDRLTQVVRSLDALARGLGLDLASRRVLARARRDAEGPAGGVDAEARAALDVEFRARARQLRAHLGAPGAGPAARALREHERRTARATRALPRETRAALAPALLHLACVRLAGADRDLERRAYTCWERTLEGLERAPPSTSSPAPVGRGFRRTRRQAT